MPSLCLPCYPLIQLPTLRAERCFAHPALVCAVFIWLFTRQVHRRASSFSHHPRARAGGDVMEGNGPRSGDSLVKAAEETATAEPKRVVISPKPLLRPAPARCVSRCEWSQPRFRVFLWWPRCVSLPLTWLFLARCWGHLCNAGAFQPRKQTPP